MSEAIEIYKEVCAKKFKLELNELGFTSSRVAIKANAKWTYLDVFHQESNTSTSIFFFEKDKNCLMLIPVLIGASRYSQSQINSIANNLLKNSKIRLKKHFDDYLFKVDNLYLKDSPEIFQNSLGIVIAYSYEKGDIYDSSVHAGLLFSDWLTFHDISMLFLDNLKEEIK
jgi:hypothetical protein